MQCEDVFIYLFICTVSRPLDECCEAAYDLHAARVVERWNVRSGLGHCLQEKVSHPGSDWMGNMTSLTMHVAPILPKENNRITPVN